MKKNSTPFVMAGTIAFIYALGGAFFGLPVPAIAADTTPPVISSLLPTGTVTAAKTTLSVKTDENATCKICNKDASYETMCREFDNTGGKTHTMDICRKRDLDVGKHTYYVRCKDSAGNINQTSSKIEFTVNTGGGDSDDTTPPVISSLLPTGTVTTGNVSLSVETDEDAYCKYCSKDDDYNDMCATFAVTGSRAHSSPMTALDDGRYVFYVRCRDKSENTNTSSQTIEFQVETGQKDTVPPKIYNPLPNGTVKTTTVAISIETDENATCKYDTKNLGYDSMANTFSATKGLSHSDTLKALGNGKYTLYIRCKDDAGNKNTVSSKIVFEVSVSSGGDDGGTGGTVISGLQPSGTVTTAQVNLGAATDANATCHYDTVDAGYADMSNVFSTTGGTAHSSPLSVLDGQHYTIYVRCMDSEGNANGSSATIDFDVEIGSDSTDKTPPVISNPTPFGTVTEKKAQISVTTDEAAICRYSNRDLPFESMCGNFLETGSKTHSGKACPVKDFSDGSKWVFYVRCKDASGNVNAASAKIQFDVDIADSTGSDATPPVITDIQHKVSYSGAVADVDIDVTTNENAGCRADSSDLDYDAMTKTFETQGQSGVSHSLTIGNLASGKHVVYVRCKDAAGNKSAASETVEFTVDPEQVGDTQPPVVLTVSPEGTIGSKKFNLAVTTDEEAICKYSLTDVGYDLMNNIFLKSGGTDHSAAVGPMDDGNYTIYIRCEDYMGNQNTTSFETEIKIETNTDDEGNNVSGDSAYLWQSLESGSLGGFWYVNWYAGYEFSPRKEGYVTELCGYYKGKNTVDLYDSDYKRLASAQVKSSRKWNCVSVSPVKVAKGKSYYVVGEFQRSPLFLEYQCCNPTLLPKTTDNYAIKWGVRQTLSETFGKKIKKYSYMNLGLVDVKMSFGGLIIDSSDDTTPPAISNIQPSNTITNKKPDLFCETDENAVCRYDVNDHDYEDMANVFTDTNGTVHKSKVGPLDNGSHTFYVRCEDVYGNSNKTGIKITFDVDSSFDVGDTTPPVVSNPSPTGSISNTAPTISVVTDENANCKYSTKNISYNAMENAFSTTGAKQHSAKTGTLNDADYIYYVRCRDASGNTNTASAKIEFTVLTETANDTAPPQISSTSVSPATGAIGASFKISTNVTDKSAVASVKAALQSPDGSTAATVTLKDDGKNGDTAAGDGIFGATWSSSGNAAGVYLIDITATDANGNSGIQDNGITFTLTDPAQAPECVDLTIAGDASKKLDVVFVPCGYGTDMAAAIADAKKHIEKMFVYTPINDYKSRYNFKLYKKTGLICNDDPCENLNNSTASQFRTYGAACGADLTVGIQKNTTGGYAGCANAPGTLCYVVGGYPESLAHESSHAVFGLADEYTYSADIGGCTYRDMSQEINCDNNSSCSKWSGTAGAQCIKGCTCSNNYRPATSCAMNDPWSTTVFCPVCKKAINGFFSKSYPE